MFAKSIPLPLTLLVFGVRAKLKAGLTKIVFRTCTKYGGLILKFQLSIVVEEKKMELSAARFQMSVLAIFFKH